MIFVLPVTAETTASLKEACQDFEHKMFKGKSWVTRSSWELIGENDPGYRTTDSSARFRWYEV